MGGTIAVLTDAMKLVDDDGGNSCSEHLVGKPLELTALERKLKAVLAVDGLREDLAEAPQFDECARGICAHVLLGEAAQARQRRPLVA